MANGIEDLKEKNKDNETLKANPKYDTWRVHQGREDAEMLQEKSADWSGKKDWARDYDSWREED